MRHVAQLWSVVEGRREVFLQKSPRAPLLRLAIIFQLSSKVFRKKEDSYQECSTTHSCIGCVGQPFGLSLSQLDEILIGLLQPPLKLFNSILSQMSIFSVLQVFIHFGWLGFATVASTCQFLITRFPFCPFYASKRRQIYGNY